MKTSRRLWALFLLTLALILLPANAWAKVDVCNIGDTDLYVA